MTAGPRLITGGIHSDTRGEVRFVNDFRFQGVDRFYLVYPARRGELRGWVGHRRDWKWFFAVQGEFEVGIVRPDDWGTPSRRLRPACFRLTPATPQILEVPPEHFTASRPRGENSILAVFSSGLAAHAAEDDYRLPPDYWSLAISSPGEG